MHLTLTPLDDRRIAYLGEEPRRFKKEYLEMLSRYPNLEKFLQFVATASKRNSVAKSVGLRILIGMREDRRSGKTTTADRLARLPHPDDRCIDTHCVDPKLQAAFYLQAFEELTQ